VNDGTKQSGNAGARALNVNETAQNIRSACDILDAAGKHDLAVAIQREYAALLSVAEAAKILVTHGENSSRIAGRTDLLIAIAQLASLRGRKDNADCAPRTCSASDYNPAKCLREEVERFKATNRFTPMDVTGFYIQAAVVLDEHRRMVEALKLFRDCTGSFGEDIRKIAARLPNDKVQTRRD
jgi:hypothetical protein